MNLSHTSAVITVEVFNPNLLANLLGGLPLIYKADCNCNLRERWRILYYDGDAEKKCFRDAHTDWTSFSCHRRMSIIIGLVNPCEYEGGELVFPNNNLRYKIEKGSAVIFDGKLLHEVLPVTKGKRYVIQAFMLDDSGYDLKKEAEKKQNKDKTK